MSGESMAHKVISKVNARLKSLHRKNKYLTPNIRRLLSNSLIQSHFNYACWAWYPKLSKKLKNKIQNSQNKCIRFCQQLEFETINTVFHYSLRWRTANKWKRGEACHNINKRAKIRIQTIASCVNFSKIWAKNSSRENLEPWKYLISNGLLELPA